MNELENCPFCGAPNPHIWKRDDGWCIKCVDGCSVSISGYDSKAGAARAWNRRPRPDADGDDPQVAYIAEIEAENERLRGELATAQAEIAGTHLFLSGAGAPDNGRPLIERIESIIQHYIGRVGR